MQTLAGDRLRALRQLIGLKQDEMAELLGIKEIRYKNVEKKNVRMAEDEFSAVCSQFPEFSHYITHEGPINFDELQASQRKFVKFAAAAIEAGKIPEGYFLEESLK